MVKTNQKTIVVSEQNEDVPLQKPVIGTKYFYLQHSFSRLECVVKEGTWKDYDSDIYRLASGNFYLDEGEARVQCYRRNKRIDMLKNLIRK
ncbi:MAG: hypothetical protein II812_03540 [Prevotella sp.]|nr:hypothetical protein [Prevotella sp.]